MTRAPAWRLPLPALAAAWLLAAPPPSAQEPSQPGGRERAGRAAEADTGTIAAITARVSPERLLDGVLELESFQTRDATTSASRSAANFLSDYFAGLGLQVGHEDFTFAGTIDGGRVPDLPSSNVIATIPGTVSPDEIVVIGAHYDSWSRGGTARTLAPGADDNGSGTAAIMEIARVLARRRFDFTVRIVAFGAEEYGLHGSRYHAERARARGDRIVGVVNLDMVGYADRPPEDLDLVVNAASEWLAVRYAGAAGRHAPMPIVRAVAPQERASDHAPFWDNGYSAMLAIEDGPVTNPHYHTTADTADTLDLEFAAAVTRATAAGAADLAQPSRSPAPPTGLEAGTFALRSPFARVKITRLAWTPPPGGARGYHVYRSTTPHLDYRRLTTEPVGSAFFEDRVLEAPDLSYYYVVTAVDAAGAESNYSPEVSGDAGAR